MSLDEYLCRLARNYLHVSWPLQCIFGGVRTREVISGGFSSGARMRSFQLLWQNDNWRAQPPPTLLRRREIDVWRVLVGRIRAIQGFSALLCAQLPAPNLHPLSALIAVLVRANCAHFVIAIVTADF